MELRNTLRMFVEIYFYIFISSPLTYAEHVTRMAHAIDWTTLSDDVNEFDVDTIEVGGFYF
jgi:hypothetical protein